MLLSVRMKNLFMLLCLIYVITLASVFISFRCFIILAVTELKVPICLDRGSYKNLLFFIPPASKKLEGHIAFGLFAHPYKKVCSSVCYIKHMIRNG